MGMGHEVCLLESIGFVCGQILTKTKYVYVENAGLSGLCQHFFLHQTRLIPNNFVIFNSNKVLFALGSQSDFF